MTAEAADLRQLEAWGGWFAYSVADATPVPLLATYRAHEVDCSHASGTAIMPRWSPLSVTVGGDLQPGVEHVVWNTGAQDLDLLDHEGDPVGTVPAGAMDWYVLRRTAAGVRSWVRTHRVTAPVSGSAIPTNRFALVIYLSRSQNNCNVLARAVAAGYDGTEPAVVQVHVLADVAIGSASSAVAAIDWGTTVGGVSWHATCRFLLVIHGMVGGKGGDAGDGGVGGTGASTGNAGAAGGRALRLTKDVSILNRGMIHGGGGGGGGGGGKASDATCHGGGGGGGAGLQVDPNGFAHGGERGFGPGDAQDGQDGTTAAEGFGGLGSNGGGFGGAGGPLATSGSGGASASGGASGGAGGAAGPAISKAAGVTITWLATGTVVGTEVVE